MRSSLRFFRLKMIFSASSSARTASVSAPSTGTFRPSPMLAPFHSIGSAGTRNGAPSALKLLTRPPGRNTCGSLNRSSGRLIGEKQMLSRSSTAESSAAFHCLITSAARGMIRERARMRSVVVRKLGSSRNSVMPNSRQKLCQWPSVTTPMKMRSPPASRRCRRSARHVRAPASSAAGCRSSRTRPCAGPRETGSSRTGRCGCRRPAPPPCRRASGRARPELEITPNMPPMMSLAEEPTRCGFALVPVMVASPDIICTTSSSAGRCS